MMMIIIMKIVVQATAKIAGVVIVTTVTMEMAGATNTIIMTIRIKTTVEMEVVDRAQEVMEKVAHPEEVATAEGAFRFVIKSFIKKKFQVKFTFKRSIALMTWSTDLCKAMALLITICDLTEA